jgi:hypothetical protein
MDIECELGGVNGTSAGLGNLVRLVRAKNFEFRPVELAERGDPRLHGAKSVVFDSLAQVTHRQGVARHKLNGNDSRFQTHFNRLHTCHPMDGSTHTTSAQLAVKAINLELNLQVFRMQRPAGK